MIRWGMPFSTQSIQTGHSQNHGVARPISFPFKTSCLLRSERVKLLKTNGQDSLLAEEVACSLMMESYGGKM
jgi:hypothetical protein